MEINDDWFTVLPLSGNGNDILTVIVDENTSSDPRNGQITLVGEGGTPVRYLTVSQAGVKQNCGEIIDGRNGKVYQTVIIGTQCWMAQNLNVRTKIDAANDQIDNGTLEKYCCDNIESNCDMYGGLYQWNELMQYSTTPSVQGICPLGWHVPSDDEWTTLTNFVSNQHSYWCNSDPVNIGKAFASNISWNPDNVVCSVCNDLQTNNSTGFSALSCGNRSLDGFTHHASFITYWWSSSESDYVFSWLRQIRCGETEFIRGGVDDKNYGYSIRYLKD